MITCGLRYEIDPGKLSEFEAYAKQWIPLVEAYGGRHHGYFLPHEGANDIAHAYFSFPSFAAYELYRVKSVDDPVCQAAYALAAESGCIRRYERQFYRPLFGEFSPSPEEAM